jgi:hypothetical protein
MTSSLVAPYVSPLASSARGSQEPRIWSYPPYASSAGPEVINVARLAGIELDPWQQQELTHGLGEAPDWKCSRCTYRVPDRIACPAHPRAGLIHPWAAFEVCEVVPRQNGKSELLVARMLGGLFVLEEQLQIYSAHLFDTAMEIFRRLAFVIENCDDLRREVKHRGSRMVGVRNSHGEEGVELGSGLRVRFKARTGGGGRGFSCDTLYLDEAMILPESFLGATVPTLSAMPNPQIHLAGSAADEEDPSHDGIVLAKRRARAIRGGDLSLAYFEHSAEGEHPDSVAPGVLDDPRQWARANPGLGIRITPEYVANERAAMGSRQFAVERLGIGAWPDITEDAGRVIGREAWAAIAEHDPANRIVSVPVFALDAAPDQTCASIAVAGKRADGLYQFAVVAHERGTDWLVERCQQLKAAHSGCKFVIDTRGSVAEKIDDLKAAHVRLIEASTTDYARAYGGFISAVSEGRARYPAPQPELDEALAGAIKAPMGDAFKWSRKNSTSTITPLVAVTLALWGAERQKRARAINPADILGSN